MLLAIDVGNSNTVLGLYDELTPELAPEAPPKTPQPHPHKTRLNDGSAAKARARTPHFSAIPRAQWRITTLAARTADEFGVLLQSLFHLRDVTLADVTGLAISSVVPQMDSTLRHVCELFFKLRPLFIEPGVKTGLPILTDNPIEVGADRICNCVAAFEHFRSACIIVDMGTATTFDVVSAKGEFLGGAIAPGLGISADALFTRAARLPRIDVRKPAKIIGTGTVDNIQIGLYYGYIGLVDGILERMLAELSAISAAPNTVKIIATGGLAQLIADGSKFIGEVDESLTLTGLRLIFERNGERQQRQEKLDRVRQAAI